MVQAGSGDDPAGKFGVANIQYGDAQRGRRLALVARDRRRRRVPRRTEFGDHELPSDASAVRLNVPVARLRDALPIMADVALRPTFPTQDLERLRQERLTALLHTRRSGADRAARVCARGVRADASLRHRPGRDRDDPQRLYRPGSPVLSSGDVSTIECDADRGRQRHGRRGHVAAREQHFGLLEGRCTRAPDASSASGAVERRRRSRSSMCPWPNRRRYGSAGSGCRGGIDAYFTLQVLNTILGGSFTSATIRTCVRNMATLARRQLALRHAALPRPVPGGCRSADRQDVGVVAEDCRGTERHPDAGQR